MHKHLGLLLLTFAIAAPEARAAEHRSTPAARPSAYVSRCPDGERRASSVERCSAELDDPADSLYRAARAALNDGDFRRAASLFHRLGERYPKSTYAPDAPYWEAFALYRVGDEASLHEAQRVLDAGRRRFPHAATSGDAEALAAQINGRLARLGDPKATAALAGTAKGEKGASSAKGASDARCTTRGGDDEGDDESDTRIVALNALLQMDAERAMPILRDVLARRDACSEGLRRKAVFLVAQKNTPEAADILLGAARNDPDREVRRQAVFWLSQVHSSRATTALDSILHSASADPELRERAIFALSQQNDAGARQTLRDLAKSDAPVELRRKAVFWLGQQDRSTENATFLRSLYASPAGAPLRDDIIQAAAQGGAESDEWLLGLARDPKQDAEQRKKALFWLGQQRRIPATEFAKLYDQLTDRDVREHLIFVLSQRRERDAVDKLFDIARNEKDGELRNKAIFWLGQSDDPRVQKFLLEIINK